MALDPRVLTSLATVKTELGITDNSQDARLERLITVSTDMIEDECDRTFAWASAISEKVQGFGSPFLLVSKRPVLSIVSITDPFSTVLDPTTDYELYLDPITHRCESGKIARLAGVDPTSGSTYFGSWMWTKARKPDIVQTDPLVGTESDGYTVVYTAGYSTPEQVAQSVVGAPARSLPYGLEQGCIELVTSIYRNAGKDRNLTLDSFGTGQQQHNSGRQAIPPAVMAMIAPFRSLR